jgi:hypothetical protein
MKTPRQQKKKLQKTDQYAAPQLRRGGEHGMEVMPQKQAC